MQVDETFLGEANPLIQIRTETTISTLPLNVQDFLVVMGLHRHVVRVDIGRQVKRNDDAIGVVARLINGRQWIGGWRSA